MTQAHIFYAGIVQGVGFRYTVYQYAERLQLTGWVKNLPDGRVEVLVDGEQKVIEKLCAQIESHYDGSIRDKNITFRESQGQFKDFEIRH